MALWNLAFYLLWCTLDTSLVFSKIQEILLAHIAIISDSPTLHWDTNNQNLPWDKDYRSDPPPGYPISPLDGCYAETQASAGCQLTRLSRHKPQTFATLPGIWHSRYLADIYLIISLSLVCGHCWHTLGMAHGNTHCTLQHYTSQHYTSQHHTSQHNTLHITTLLRQCPVACFWADRPVGQGKLCRIASD